jgi:hypothetical protein
MGKKIKLREAERRAADEALQARLRAHARTDAGPAFIGCYAEFAPLYRARIESYRGFAIRAPEAWRCRVRVRDPEQRFLDLVRFTFARFPVALHLEQAWTDELHAAAGHGRGADALLLPELAQPDFRHWYILAAQGNSFYRETASCYLSRRETHYFLAAPAAVTSTTRAFWYAIARAVTEDDDVALRIARSKIAAFPVMWTFWRGAATFFARNPMQILEMNDMIDFFQAADDDGFTLDGRSLPALRRRMAEWHQTLRRRAIACGGRWNGRAMPDAVYETNDENGRAVWWLRQLKSGDELFREGERMHHCVVSYMPRCLAGLCSIWSLSCEYPAGKLNRGLTIEVDQDGAIVQCRGLANRAPYSNETAMVRRWAGDNGLSW